MLGANFGLLMFLIVWALYEFLARSKRIEEESKLCELVSQIQIRDKNTQTTQTNKPSMNSPLLTA